MSYQIVEHIKRSSLKPELAHDDIAPVRSVVTSTFTFFRVYEWKSSIPLSLRRQLIASILVRTVVEILLQFLKIGKDFSENLSEKALVLIAKIYGHGVVMQTKRVVYVTVLFIQDVRDSGHLLQHIDIGQVHSKKGGWTRR